MLLNGEVYLCFCLIVCLISFQQEQETDPRKRSFFLKLISSVPETFMWSLVVEVH